MRFFWRALLSTVLVATGIPVRAELLSAELARSQVRVRLTEQGMDAHQAEARVAALTDEEAALLASRLDQLPAGAGGGDPTAIVLGVAIYLVIKYLLPYILVGGGFLLLARAANNSQAEQEWRPSASEQ